MEHEPENARGGRGEVLGDGGVEVVGRRHLVLRRGDEVSQLLAPRRHSSRLALCLLRDRTEGLLPILNRPGLVADELHDSGDCVVACSAAQENDVLARLGVELARIGLVGEERGRAGDVRTGEEYNALVGLVGAEAQEHAACALVVGRLVRRDGETERRGEWLAEARNALHVVRWVESHELPLAAVDRLDKRDLDLREAGGLEYGKRKEKKTIVSALFIRNMNFCVPRESR